MRFLHKFAAAVDPLGCAKVCPWRLTAFFSAGGVLICSLVLFPKFRLGHTHEACPAHTGIRRQSKFTTQRPDGEIPPSKRRKSRRTAKFLPLLLGFQVQPE